MTALKLTRPLAEELGILIQRFAEPISKGDGLTAEELIDLRSWLRAAREKHWDELRAERGRRVVGEVVNFERVARIYEGQPCDTEPKGAA